MGKLRKRFRWPLVWRRTHERRVQAIERHWYEKYREMQTRMSQVPRALAHWSKTHDVEMTNESVGLHGRRSHFRLREKTKE